MGSLREKLLKKKADRRKKEEGGESDTPAQDLLKAKKIEKLQQMAELKDNGNNSNAVTNLVKMCIMLFLGCFAGYRSYNTHRVDMVGTLSKRQQYLHSTRAPQAASKKGSSKQGGQGRSLSQAELDKMFDEGVDGDAGKRVICDT